MDKIRPFNSYGVTSRNCYFAPRVVQMLRYAQTPACRHIEEEKNNGGITDCQLLVAMAEADKNFLAFLGLRQGDKGSTNVLRKKLGIVPTALQPEEKSDISIPEAEDEPVSYKQMSDIFPCPFTYRVLHKAGGIGDHPRIAYSPEILASLGAHVYGAHIYLSSDQCSTEVNDLLVECALATAKEFTARAKEKKIFLPPVFMESFIFPNDIGCVYDEGIPAFVDLEASYLEPAKKHNS